MKGLLFFLILFSGVHLYAQTRISGRVMDAQSKAGIPKVSVYLNNSTYGAITDEDGNFSFTGTLTGKASLIISHLSYERVVYEMKEDKVTDLKFYLQPQSNVLNEVIIKSKKHSKADLTRWIQLFSENLIGKYKVNEHGYCKILNENALYFDFDRTENNLRAFASEPLTLENTFLAYQIKIELEQFEYNFNSNELIFKYYVFYEELPRSKLAKEQIRKNRMLAYEGSAMHFMRSIYTNKSEQEFFYVYKYKAIQNKEKQRISSIIRKRIAEVYAKEETPDISLSRFFLKDTLQYYARIMREDDLLSVRTEQVDPRLFIQRDKYTRTVNFNFPDTIMVNYDKNKLKRDKLLAGQLAANKDNPEFAKPFYLSTYLYFFKEGGVNIQRNGYYPEFSLYMWGDMAERRIGVSLPYDFDPDQGPNPH